MNTMRRVHIIQGGEIGSMLGITDVHKTKDIYETDSSFVIAYKIMNYFDIGDKVKIEGVEPVHFKRKEEIYQIPTDICCSIIGTSSGHCVVYPKGYLVAITLIGNGKTFKYTVHEKHYEIWRSR